jgi:hypothetical protein
MRLEQLDAGHWGNYYIRLRCRVTTDRCFAVHAEKPTEFRKLVVDFLNNPY